MFRHYTLPVKLHTNLIKQAESDPNTISAVVQSVYCQPHRGCDYTRLVKRVAVKLPVNLDNACVVAFKLIRYTVNIARKKEIMLTMCDTMEIVDHYIGNTFKYYLDTTNIFAIHDIIATWIKLVHLRPILKLINLGRNTFKVSLQIYTKKQLWVTGFVIDPAYQPPSAAPQTPCPDIPAKLVEV